MWCIGATEQNPDTNNIFSNDQLSSSEIVDQQSPGFFNVTFMVNGNAEDTFLKLDQWTKVYQQIYYLQKQPPRLFSKISVLFFQEHLFLENRYRYHFSRSYVYVFTKQITIFQEHYFGYRTDTDFPRAPLQPPNRYQFFRSTFFLATEQITIFQEHFFLLPNR